ncbi:MAG TPA: LacI family DNA-binding transcriptional regulator [Puia sp.]
MERSKDITIYDIARDLRVSPSTVSRALNDDPTVSKKTRKRVFDKAMEMGYRSNQFAKNLRQQQSLTIGIIVYQLNSPFMTSVLSGIEKVANEAGYGIIIMDSAESVEKERANIQSLFQRRVDGVIAFPAPGSNEPAHFAPLLDKNIPVIFLDRPAVVPGIPSVVIDNVRCGHMATRHLIEQGCERIAFVSSPMEDEVYALRCNGYRAALKESDLPFDESLLLIAAPTEEESAAVARRLLRLSPAPDGLFATSDLTAAVCIRQLLDSGVRVPEDIAVVGFNNDVLGKLIRPALSTVNYPGMEMGETAVSTLLKHLKGLGAIDNITSVTIRAELIVRESSLKRDAGRPK